MDGIGAGRLYRLTVCTGRYGASAYSVDDLITDAKKGVWSELAAGSPIDINRRNLQKVFIEALDNLVTPPPAQPQDRRRRVFTR